MHFQLVQFISCFVIINTSLAPSTLLVTRIGPCYDDLHNTIMKISEFSVETQTYNSKLSGVFNISENIENGWRIKATMQKCVDIRNIDSCDFFKSLLVVENGCNEKEDKQLLYTMLFDHASPKLECPVRAGHYELINYPLYSEDHYKAIYGSKISTSVFGYTLRLDGITVDQRKMFCIEAYLQLLYKRKHEWEDNKGIPVTMIDPSEG